MTEQVHAKSSRAAMLIAATAVLWSFGGLLIKLVDWNPLAIAGVRSAIASMLLLLYIRRPKLKFTFPIIGGAICYALTVILFVMANKLTTAANAIFLQYTAPIYIAVFGSIFLKEHIRAADWISTAALLGGMMLFFIDRFEAGNLTGNILAAASAVTFAGISLFMRGMKEENPLEIALWGNILTAVAGIPFMTGSSPGIKGWLILLLLGIFQLGLSYILYTKAIKHVRAIDAALILFLEPVLNPVWVYFILGETPGIWSILGGAVILTSVAVRCLRLLRKTP